MTDPESPSLELGLIGNSAFAALIDERGRVVWQCLPRFDGDPVYCRLLGGAGEYAVELSRFSHSSQAYDLHTPMLRTMLFGEQGAAIELLDFAPRFYARGRVLRPQTHVRCIRPISGAPRITIRVRPYQGWGAQPQAAKRGSDHISFHGGDAGFRLTTTAPVAFIQHETTFRLDREVVLIAGPDEPLADAPDRLAQTWEIETRHYWREWVRSLAIPLDWQEAVIRAAITLKLCVYEDTGGIVAALTSSIPEHAGSNRTWDYRYCWLRDAYFTVTALNRLSATDTLEHYLGYLANITAMSEGRHIQPVFGIGLETELIEREIVHLPGFAGGRPVRQGNQAATHQQHDVYGHIVLGSSQAFFDTRLLRPADQRDFFQLEKVGERGAALVSEPDAGIWEYRNRARVHTSSVLMSWAACDRLAKIATHLGLDERALHWGARAEQIKKTLINNAWDQRQRAFTGAYGSSHLDASVLLMAEVGFLRPTDERFVATVEAIGRALRRGDYLMRYTEPDDFGVPQSAFIVCTLWYIDALAQIGRIREARAMFEAILARRTKLGLLSEDIDPTTGQLWGNFPQTYSLVGIINAAARLSRPWTSMV
ncbi:MAG: glycoside hydrolase family 15 protein [Enhygromyxa sp.]